MDVATSVETTPRLISQSKNLSPASPDQRVPSQSKAATSGCRRRTESRKSEDESGMDVLSLAVNRVATLVFFAFLRGFSLRSFVIKGSGNSRRRSSEFGVIVWRVDIQSYQGIVDWNVYDVLLMRVLNVASRGSRRGLQESLDQFAACNVGMTVLAGKFRHHGPCVICGGFESFAKHLNGRQACRWTVDESDHRRVAATVEDLMQADLQRAELAAVGIGIDDDRCAFRISHRGDGGFVLAGNHNNEIGGEWKRTDSSGEKRIICSRLPF